MLIHPLFTNNPVQIMSFTCLASQLAYLPHTSFPPLLPPGTTYLFTNNPVQIMSVTCLLSCSSSLFMSSIIASLLVEPLKLFHLEHSDGISKSHELILQVFIRMTALGTLPLSLCGTIVFGLVYQTYTFQTYLVLLLAFLLVNQVWISIFIVLTVLAPSQAHRLCPVFAAIGGYCCGFIVPKSLMPPYYRWIFYINPSFYAYSAMSVTVLEANTIHCSRSSTLECFRDSGIATIESFGLSNVNPFENLVVLMAMVILLVSLGILVLQLKVDSGLIKENLFNMFCSASKRHKYANILSHSSSLPPPSLSSLPLWFSLPSLLLSLLPFILSSLSPFLPPSPPSPFPQSLPPYLTAGGRGCLPLNCCRTL